MTASERPGRAVYAAALRALAARRLTEAQLWQRLERRAYDPQAIRDAVAACKREGLLDDGLFARLYVEGKRKRVGDLRLVAELVRKGIARDAAVRAVAEAQAGEDERLREAIEALYRRRPEIGYPHAARALERLGFRAAGIYRELRERAAAEFRPSSMNAASHSDGAGDC